MNIDVINQLSSYLGRRDEIPNQQLAQKIASTKDTSAIKELVALLQHPKKAIQNDVIKVLYEIGKENPKLISPFCVEFIALLKSKNNRMVWCTMTALSVIVNEKHDVIFKNLSAIMQAADLGSVIAKDHAAKILTSLSQHKKYRNITLPILIDFINTAPENQFPTYAENAISVVEGEYKKVLLQVLESRIDKMQTPTKIVRVEKLIKKLKK
jgi:hypothetical protein